MKAKINNYAFNKTAKTVTFTDYTTIRLDGILLITNVTDGIIIYNFADPAKGGTVLTNVLTLTFDTAAMEDTDNLLIYYDDTETAATESKQDEIIEEISNKDIMIALKALIQGIAYPPYMDRSANQIRSQITGAVTVSSGTVTTVTNVTNFGTFPADHLQRQINLMNWSNTVRTKIT